MKFKSVKRKTIPKGNFRLLRKKQPIYLALLGLGLILLFILLGKTLSFLGSLSSPFSPDAATSKNYSWSGNSTINLAIKSDAVYALSFNPQSKTATILKIPDNTYLDLPFNFGRWPTRSVYDLGQAERPPMGARLLKKTVQVNLGIPVDGYILLNQAQSADEVIKDLKSSPWALLGLIRNIRTDLNTFELLKLFWQLRSVRSDNLKSIDLLNSSVTTSLLLPDGSRALGIDQSRLDSLIQAKFEDTRLADEGLSISIYNGTKHPKLAEMAARMITNMGGRVIFTSNTQKSYSTSVVVGSPAYSKLRLSQVFAPNCLGGKLLFGLIQRSVCDINDPDIAVSRADITVVLGEKFYNSLNTR